MQLTCGVGYNDGKYPTRLGNDRPIHYIKWRSMIIRCYDPKFLNRNPHYIDCTVSDNFKNYSYFYEWYESQVVNGFYDLQVDKDLLVKNNCIYSENNCLLLPIEINNTFNRQRNKRNGRLIGVCFSDRHGKYVSYVSINKRNKTIGYFDTEIEAHLAYKTEKEKHIKFLANKYSSVINEKAYNALMNYTVEITD